MQSQFYKYWRSPQYCAAVLQFLCGWLDVRVALPELGAEKGEGEGTDCQRNGALLASAPAVSQEGNCLPLPSSSFPATAKQRATSGRQKGHTLRVMEETISTGILMLIAIASGMIIGVSSGYE